MISASFQKGIGTSCKGTYLCINHTPQLFTCHICFRDYIIFDNPLTTHNMNSETPTNETPINTPQRTHYHLDLVCEEVQ